MVRPLHIPQKCPKYDTKPSDSEAPVLELSRLRSTPSLLLLPGPPRLGVVVSFRVLSMGEIKLFNHLSVCKQMTDVKLNCLFYMVMLETI